MEDGPPLHLGEVGDILHIEVVNLLLRLYLRKRVTVVVLYLCDCDFTRWCISGNLVFGNVLKRDNVQTVLHG